VQWTTVLIFTVVTWSQVQFSLMYFSPLLISKGTLRSSVGVRLSALFVNCEFGKRDSRCKSK
jgi:hypothetical protein